MSVTCHSHSGSKELTAKQRRAILLLAFGSPPAEVALEVGVATGTVYNWKSQHVEFQAELEAAQVRVQIEGARQLKCLVAEAASSLRSILICPTAADRDKIAAARTVLQFSDSMKSIESPEPVEQGGTDDFLKRLGLE